MTGADNDTNNLPNNPHDTGYRSLFNSKTVFLQLIKSFIKHGWAEQIDEATLERYDRSFILIDYTTKEADIVYKARIKDKNVFFYILMEHQSTIDFLMPYRLNQYMNELWRDVLKNTQPKEYERKNFRLPVIIPIVLYNGTSRWTVPQTFKEIFEGHELFGDYLVNFKYHLISIHDYSDEQLLSLSNLIGTVFMLDKVTGLEEIIDGFNKTIETIKKLTPEEFTLFKEWSGKILARNLPEKNKKEISNIVTNTRLEEADMMITNLERVIKESIENAEREGQLIGQREGQLIGQREGLRAGHRAAMENIAGNMLAENESIEKIVKYTGLTEKEINKLLN